jgi:hypothetical protein
MLRFLFHSILNHFFTFNFKDTAYWYKLIVWFNQIQAQLSNYFHKYVLSVYLNMFMFLRDYYLLNELIWQDGFLIDFLQKKIADKWIRQFVIHTSNLVSERLVFDYVVRFYIDTIIWPSYAKTIFKFNNIASTLLITFTILMGLFLSLTLIYFWVLIF